MLDGLRARAGGDRVRLVLGDMASPPLHAPGRFDVVFCAYNTFFNLDSPPAQRSCLDWVAGALAPGGRLGIEAFVPLDGDRTPDGPVSVRSIEPDRVVLSVARRDPDRQTVTGQFVDLTEAGGVRLRPYRIRYLFPAQLDALAAEAGLVRLQRWADWSGRPFTDDSANHVSVYGRADPP
jgi:hypothetical protein